ncbi:MAG TPA: hypothetical protein VIP28_15155 [Nocardioides sp.]
MTLSPSPLLLGAARPRVEVHPPAVDDSLGDVAAALAAQAGLPLEPWQVDGLRIMLSTRPDGKWAAFEYAEICPRQNGKTALFMARALAGLFLLDEKVILWSAHEFKTAMRAFRDLRRFIRALGEARSDTLVVVDGIPVKINNGNGEEGFERLDTGQELKMVARSKGSGRGFSTDLMIVDEAFAYTEIHQDALMPTLTARPNPQICYASSPPLDGLSGGPLFSLRKRALAGGDETLAWRDWGLDGELDEFLKLSAQERDEFLDDRARWSASNPALGRGRVNEESILRLRRSLSEAGFAREIFGLWPKQVEDAGGMWQVIDEDDWLGRAGGDKDLWTDEVAFAVASPVEQDWTAIAVAGWSSDGEILVQVVHYARGTAWVEDKILGLVERHPGAVVALDPRGPAGHLRKPLEDADVELLEPTALDGAHAAQQFVRNIVDVPTVRHFGQDSLDISVKAAVKKKQGDGWRWERRGGTDISPLDAASLAVWAVQDGGPALEPVAVGGSAEPMTNDLARMGF